MNKQWYNNVSSILINPSLIRYRPNTKGFIWVSLTGEPRQSLTPREGQSDIKRYNHWWLHSMIINI